jgi:hypothetical protein
MVVSIDPNINRRRFNKIIQLGSKGLIDDRSFELFGIMDQGRHMMRNKEQGCTIGCSNSLFYEGAAFAVAKGMISPASTRISAEGTMGLAFSHFAFSDNSRWRSEQYCIVFIDCG